MGKKYICFAILFLIITCFAKNTDAYNDTITHPDITERAAEPENSQLDQYLKNNLGFEDGLETKFTLNNKKKPIIKWLRDGAELEDDPMCRATNHFHDPTKSWDQSFMSDDTTIRGLIIRAYCELRGWTYSNRKANVTWATGYLAPAPDGPKASFPTDPDYAPINWDKAREYYYNALTSTLEEDREIYFAETFKTVGHVMHLLEDVSVPAHTRNDFTSHLTFNGIDSLDPTKWFGNPFEHYVKNNPSLVTSVQPDFLSFTDLRLTDFWDTDQYIGNNPSTSLSLGLAEFTNANYFSDETIPNNDPSTKHTFPYPQVNSTNTEICEDYTPGSTDIRKYISRKDRGDCPPLTEARTADHFATPSLLNEEYMITNDNISSLKLWLDDNVHNTYAKDILPRAVGYSAGLLDYFFRGKIEVTLPDSGVYSLTGASEGGFKRVKLLAKNTTPNNEGMDNINGSIELVVKYRLALEDPFKNYPETYPFQAEDFFRYIVVPELNNTNSIPRDNPVELTFDLTSNPIPLWAIDVYLFVVYKGRLGNEEGAVAVGLKDISEPTPVDFFNDMDMICLNGNENLFTAGSPEAIAQVDAPENGGNDNGIADEWDVYAHDVRDIYIKFSSVSNPRYASPTDYDSYIPNIILTGELLRALYILTDYGYNHNTNVYNSWINKDPNDPWIHPPKASEIWTNKPIMNQTVYYTEPEDEALCAPYGGVPCYIWWYPSFLEYRDKLIWWGDGMIFSNTAYPQDSECSCYEGILRACPLF